MRMSFDQVIIFIMAAGILIGAFDRIIGNRLGLGEKFEEGFHAMGPLALGMVGIVTLAPVLANLLGPLLIPVFGLIGADPSVFASILAIDMGGYQLATELTSNEEAAKLSGIIVASMLGCTIVFSIPVGLGLIEYKDRPFFAKGLLAGLTTIPIGGLVGGIIAGFNPMEVIINLIPVTIFSGILITGLIFFSNALIKLSLVFARFLVVIITIGLAAAAFEFLTGIVIIPGMAPIMDGIELVGNIGIILLGAFPIVHLIVNTLQKPLIRIGEKLDINATSSAGIIISIANSIPVYKMIKDMDNRGKIINIAWLVPATAALGDHLGFVGEVSPDMITPLILSKVSAGICAVGVAFVLSRDTSDLEIKNESPAKNTVPEQMVN